MSTSKTIEFTLGDGVFHKFECGTWICKAKPASSRITLNKSLAEHMCHALNSALRADLDGTSGKKRNARFLTNKETDDSVDSVLSLEWSDENERAKVPKRRKATKLDILRAKISKGLVGRL